jgi:hypothetical protein
MARNLLIGHDLLIIEAGPPCSDIPGSVLTSDRPTQRPLSDNTQHSQQTNIHAPGGIRTHSPSKLAATDRRLRPRGHQDRHVKLDVACPIKYAPIKVFLPFTPCDEIVGLASELLMFTLYQDD